MKINKGLFINLNHSHICVYVCRYECMHMHFDIVEEKVHNTYSKVLYNHSELRFTLSLPPFFIFLHMHSLR